MNEKVIKLTIEIGKVYVEIAKLKAKREVLEAKIWQARAEDINKIAKKNKKARSKPQN